MRIKKLEIDYEYLVRLSRLGEGKYSIVYRNKDKAYKYMKEGTILERKDIQGIIDRNNSLRDLYKECGNVIIPQEELIVRYANDSILKGYSREYIDGYNLKELYEEGIQFDIDEFEELIDPIRNTIETLTKNKICLHDLHAENIMYDIVNKRLVFIDSDFWCYSSNNSRTEEINLRNFDNTFNKYSLIKRRR